MKSNLSRICHAVFCEPWLVDPAHHAVIREIVMQHISGMAHLPGGCAVAYDDKDGENDNSILPEMHDGVAVISISGTTGMRVGSMAKSSGMADYLDIQDALEMAVRDKDTQAIVLSIDSPGGTSTGCFETAAMIRSIADNNVPVVAFTDSLMASAAYEMGSQADAIVAAQSSRIGSIGAYISLLDESAAYAAQGFKRELFASGQYKGMGAPGKPLTDAQRDYLQAQVDQCFSEFKATVLSQRPNIKDDAMQGQTFTAGDALVAGLIDQIGGLDSAIELAREIINAKE